MEISMPRSAACVALALCLGYGNAISVSEADAQERFLRGALLRLTVGGTPNQVVVELASNQILESQIQTIGMPASRLFLDLPNIVPDVPEVTEVNLGAVQRVRVALNRSEPPVTRVVLDLDNATTFALEQGPTPQELRIIVETDTSHNPRDVDKYSVWFSRVTQNLAHLLNQTAKLHLDGVNKETDHQRLQLEWEFLQQDLRDISPPSTLEPVHALLMTVGSIGRASAETAEDYFVAADVQSAVAGATMLVIQAKQLAANQLIDSLETP
jgi:hypothetical protein